MGDKNHTQISRSSKGAYSWVYQVNLYRNPMLLFLVWKVLLLVWLLVATFILLISVPGPGSLDTLKALLPILFCIGLLVLGLAAAAYYFYALIMKGRYTVLFEMDSKGIRHSQIASQAKKARTLGAVTAAAGLAAKSPAAVSAGMAASAKQSSYTPFQKVNAIRVKRKKQTIKLRSSLLMHNQVYAAEEDFDFVLGFIEDHLPAGVRWNN